MDCGLRWLQMLHICSAAGVVAAAVSHILMNAWEWSLFMVHINMNACHLLHWGCVYVGGWVWGQCVILRLAEAQELPFGSSHAFSVGYVTMPFSHSCLSSRSLSLVLLPSLLHVDVHSVAVFELWSWVGFRGSFVLWCEAQTLTQCSRLVTGRHIQAVFCLNPVGFLNFTFAFIPYFHATLLTHSFSAASLALKQLESQWGVTFFMHTPIIRIRIALLVPQWGHFFITSII